MDDSSDWKLELCQRQLYVLELTGGKYYVGQAKDPERRIRKHFNGSGSAWTRMHPPLREMSRTDLGIIDYRAGELAENEVVLILMRQHGFQNVRGGFFTNISPELTAKALIKHGYGDVAAASPAAQPPSLDALNRSESGHVVTAEYSLFVLLLEGNKYFVGYSSNPEFRIRRHFAGKAAEWTTIHKPVEILTTRSLGFVTESAAAQAADSATIALMRKAGWKNVRGGSWWKTEPDEMLRMLRSRGHHDIPAECPSNPKDPWR